jgi:hypothetical protein
MAQDSKAQKPTMKIKQYIGTYSYLFQKNGVDVLELSSDGSVFVHGKKIDESNPIVSSFQEWCKS